MYPKEALVALQEIIDRQYGVGKYELTGEMRWPDTHDTFATFGIGPTSAVVIRHGCSPAENLGIRWIVRDASGDQVFPAEPTEEERQIAQLESELSIAKAEYGKLDDKYESLRAENESVWLELEESDQDCDKLRDDLDNLECEYQDYIDKARALRSLMLADPFLALTYLQKNFKRETYEEVAKAFGGTVEELKAGDGAFSLPA